MYGAYITKQTMLTSTPT